MSVVMTITILVTIDGVTTDYLVDKIMSMNNFELLENSGLIGSRFGNLEISKSWFRDNLDITKKEFDVQIKVDENTLFDGYAYRTQTTESLVTLRLIEDFEDIDLLDEYECENCEEEKYLRPLLFGDVKFAKLPLLSKVTREYLMPDGGFVSQSYSGSSEIGSTNIDIQNILWLEPLRDVYFDLKSGDGTDYSFGGTVGVPTISGDSVSYSFQADYNFPNSQYQVFGKIKGGAWESYTDLQTLASGSFTLKNSFSTALLSKNIYDFKVVIFNSEIETFNDYYTTSTTELTTSAKNRIDDIEDELETEISIVKSRISSEASSRYSADSGLGILIGNLDTGLTSLEKDFRELKIDYAGFIVDLQDSDSRLETDLTALDTRITDIEDSFAKSLKTLADDLKDRLTKIETFLSNGIIKHPRMATKNSDGGVAIIGEKHTLNDGFVDWFESSVYLPWNISNEKYSKTDHTHTGYSAIGHAHAYQGLKCGSGGASCEDKTTSGSTS
jgi:hypothetical protein